VDSGLLRVIESDPSRTTGGALPEVLDAEEAEIAGQAGAHQKAWLGNLFGTLEEEPRESAAWIDTLLERAIIDEAAAPWGVVDLPQFDGGEVWKDDEEDWAEEALDSLERAAAGGDDWVDAPGARSREDDLFSEAGSGNHAFEQPTRPVPLEAPAPWTGPSWSDDDLEGREVVPDDLAGGPGADVDRWGQGLAEEGEDDWGSIPADRRRRTLDALAPPDPLKELDPFAAPIDAGLPDELGGFGDPFDSVVSVAEGSLGLDAAPHSAPPRDLADQSDPGDSWDSVGQAELDTGEPVEPEPVSDRIGVEPTPPPTPPAWTLSLEEARAILEARTNALQAELQAWRADDSMESSHRVLADGPDRRVVVIESAEFEVAEFDDAPDPAERDEVASEASGRRSVLAQLSEEPLDLDAPTPAPSPVRRRRPGSGRDAPEPDALAVDEGWTLPESPPSPRSATEFVDRVAVERFGVPLLGVVPTLDPVPDQSQFPPGSPVHVEDVRPAAPPLVPSLSLPEPFDLDDRDHRLLAMLQDEVTYAADRGRLALLLHAFARLSLRLPHGAGAARAATRAAHTNDPGFALNRWLLDDLVEAEGPVEAVVTHLARIGGGGTPDAGALHRAAHLALARLDDPTRALALWQRASEIDPRHVGALLARANLQWALFDWESSAAALESLSGLVEGPVLGTLIALERLRLGEELGQEESVLLQYVHEAQSRAGGTVAVAAVVERFAARTDDAELLLSLLRGRFDSVSAEFQRGRIPEESAKQEIGEIFYKAAWALERLGRKTEAMREYQNALQSLPNDPFLLHRAGDLARRLGRADEHRTHLERVAALARDPHEAANALYQMGLIAQTVLADEARAALDFERALAAMPTFTPALAALGRQALRQGRWLDLRQRFESEIGQLEEALARDLSGEVRGRTIRGLVTRYFRVARLLETQLSDPDSALAYHKRALTLDPSFLPAFLSIERLYEHGGRWRELVSLYLGLVERAGVLGVRPWPYLLRAAEVLETRLLDDRNAARAYARVLAAAPEDSSVLDRASRVFARMGGLAAQIEVDVQRARVARTPGLRGRLLQRAAELQSLDGDPISAAAEALPLHRAALEAAPTHPGPIDGLLRAAALLGRTGEVSSAAQAVRASADPDRALRMQVGDALLGADLAEEAGSHFDWSYRDRPDRESISLRVLAHERAQAWRPLVEALEDEAAATLDAVRRARVLTHVAEIHEFRLDDPATAAETYGRALALDPGNAAGREGRLRTDERASTEDLSVASRSLLSGMAGAQLAAREARGLDVAAQLERVARGRLDERTQRALTRISLGSAVEDDAVRSAFFEKPGRIDRFEAWMQRLEHAEAVEARIEACRARLPYETGSGRIALASVWLADAVRHGQGSSIQEAAHALLEADPASLPATQALREVALREGRALDAFDAGERLSGLLNTTAACASLLRILAEEALACGLGPNRARALLEQAVALDPGDTSSADQLERILREGQEWTDLLDLLNRRLTVAAATVERRGLIQSRAEVLGRHLGRSEEALETLAAVLDDPSHPQVDHPDGEGDSRSAALLAAGRLAAEFQAPEAAIRWLREASHSDSPRIAVEAFLALVQLLKDEGRGAEARTEVARALQRHGDAVRLYEVAAELAAEARAWPEVVRLQKRAFDLEVDIDRKAARALGIGEILSRVKGDPRAAAGWFRVAVELRPQERGALGRMFEELDRLPPGTIPVDQITDALDRTLISLREAIASDPFDVEHLRAYATVQLRRLVPDAAYLARSVLEYLGAADAAERTWLAQRRERLVVDLAGELKVEERATLMLDPREDGAAAAFFGPLALVLTDLFAERPPSGSTRVSARSFPRWQTEFRQIAQGLGLQELEVWQTSQTPTRLSGLYLPTPAVVVGTDVLGSPIDAGAAFRIGHLVEGLRGGRLLFDRVGPGRVAASVALIVRDLAPQFEGEFVGATELAPDFAARLRDRTQRLPRRLRAVIEARAQEVGVGAVDFGECAQAVEATRNRCGLLCCGDVAVALDRMRTALASEQDVRQIRTLEPARDLVRYLTSTAFLHLRRAFGLAVQR
jgi:tetratricopeptide (TPR) repeat protein